MTQILVSDEAAAIITSVAESRHCTPEYLLESLVSRLRDDQDSALHAYTGAAKARIQAGIAASLRGDVVPQEEVEAFMDEWQRELQA